jgi:hypothetical protein
VPRLRDLPDRDDAAPGGGRGRIGRDGERRLARPIGRRLIAPPAAGEERDEGDTQGVTEARERDDITFAGGDRRGDGRTRPRIR